MSMQSLSAEGVRQALSDYSSHLATILDGALMNFQAKENPLRFTNTANALRELVREFFEIIAPDDKIKEAHWFELDDSSKTGFTRAHRVRYAVYGNLPRTPFDEDFSAGVIELEKTVKKKIDALSKLTHVNEKVLRVTEEDAFAKLDAVIEFLENLIEAISHGKQRLLEELEEIVQDELNEMMIGDFFDDLDQLSTHTRPQYVDDLNVTIDDVTPDTIHYSVTGSVWCELQMGSDGDCRRGDGLEWGQSFSFKFTSSVPTDDPKAVEITASDLEFDTSDYWDDSGDEESQEDDGESEDSDGKESVGEGK